MERPRVSVLIPAYNEEKRIYQTVRSVLQVPWVDEVIVVDDASTDRTAELAQAAGARVIRLGRNRGKGGALNRGAAEVTGQVVVLLDADVGETAVEVEKLIQPVLAGLADMTIARFPKSTRKAGFGLVKGLARWGIRRFTGLEVEAPLSGQRAMTREVFQAILPFQSGYGVEVGLTIDVARRGYRIMEVETAMRHAETGRDLRGFLHRGKQFCHVAKVLLKKAFAR